MHKEKSALDIFCFIDETKVKSCMTLFALISEEGSVFHQVLECFYEGEMDSATLEHLKK